MSARVPVTVRLAPAGVVLVDQLAEACHVDRSKAARALLAEALGDPRLVARARARLQRDEL